MGIDESNKQYWTELSGSRAIHKLKISQGDPSGAAVFDDWFFWYYPYLDSDRFIPWNSLGDKRVLEIGLGFGTVGRRISRSGALYTGIDISDGPTQFLSQTVSRERGHVLQASALALPFNSNSFDTIISIGCLHHTGDIKIAFDECQRVLKPNGELIVMVYNAISYKRWIIAPFDTWRRFRGKVISPADKPISDRGTGWYDRHLDGTAAPFTEFVARRDLSYFLEGYENVVTEIVNIDNIQDLFPPKFQRRSIDNIRRLLLKLWFVKHIGLDLYVRARKSEAFDSSLD